MTTWKKYGGTGKLDTLNNITVNSMVADYFSLRKVYVGTFDISGILHVSGKITTETNLYSNNIINKNDISTNTIHIAKDAIIAGNIILTSNQYIYAGNVFLYNNMDISGNLSVKKSIYLGYAGAYLNGEDMCGNIGINTKTPIAALDISTNQLQSINVQTSRPINYSVLSRTSTNRGIGLYTDASSSKIYFYNDDPINITGNYNGKIEYQKGGILNIDVSDNMNVYSKMVISKDKTKTHLLNEQLIIHNSLNTTPFLQGIYEKQNVYAGNAITLVGGDNNTNTFLNIVTPNKKGFSIGGGPYPNNTNRTIGTIGVTDSSNGYIPSVTILSGQSVRKLKTTIGINNNAPTTDKYSLEVNGPIRIRNGEISQYIEPGYEILSGSYLKTNTNRMIFVGSPYTLTKKQKIVYTIDGGETWNTSFDLSGKSIETSTLGPVNLNSVYMYDSSLVFIAGDYGFALYSNNGGANWYSITLPTTGNIYTGSNVKINNILSTQERIYTAYKNINSTYGYITHFTKPTNIYTDTTGFSTQNIIKTDCSNIRLINYMTTDASYLYAIGERNIERFTLPNLTSPQIYENPLPITYKHIFNLDGSNVIAVGTNIITYTHTNNWSSSSEWTNISVPYILNYVYIYDASRAVAVGGSGEIIYTEDGYNTWNTIAYNTLNSSGNADVLLNSNLKFIFMKNLNELVITKTTTSFNGSINTLGNSTAYGCYIPTLYNNSTNYLMDISGIATISGDMRVNDGGKISTNNSTFDLLNENVSNINFGTNSLNTTMGGNAYIPRLGVGTRSIASTNTLEVSGNMQVTGDVILSSSATDTIAINGNTTFANAPYMSGANIAFGSIPASSVVGGPGTAVDTLTDQIVGGTKSFTNRIIALSDLSVNQNIITNGNVIIQQNLNVNGITTLSGNTNLNGNVNIGNDATDIISINGNINFLTAPVMSGANISSTTIPNSALQTISTSGKVANSATTATIDNNASTIVLRDLSGDIIAVTKPANTSNTAVATTAFVSTAISNLIGGAPGVLDTLNELAEALGNDASLSSTLTNRITRVDTSVNDLTDHIVDTDASVNLLNTKIVTIDASINGNIDVNGNANINKNLNVTGITTLSGNTNLNGNITLGDASVDTITINGNTTFIIPPYLSGNNITTASILPTAIIGGVGLSGVDLSSNQTISGIKSFFNTLVALSDTSLNTNLRVGGNTTMVGTSTYTSTAIFNGDASLNANLLVLGNTNLNSNLLVGGNITLTGKTTFISDASLNKSIFIAENANIRGTSSHGGTATFNGDTTMNANLSVTGNTTILGITTQSGKASFLSETTINANLIVNGTATISGLTTHTGRTTLNGDTTMNASLLVSGNSTFSGRATHEGFSVFNSDVTLNTNLMVNGNSTMSGTTTHTGRTTFTASVLINSNLSVSGIATFNGDINSTENLSVTGNVILSSNTKTTTINGNTTFTSAPYMSGANITTASIPSSAVNGVVTTTGNQSISGIKTFTGQIIASPGNASTNGIAWINPADGSEGSYIRYYNRTGSDAVLEIGTTDDPNDHINLNPSGKVGIKNNNPVYDLDVNGSVRIKSLDIQSANGTMLFFSEASCHYLQIPSSVLGTGSAQPFLITSQEATSTYLSINPKPGNISANVGINMSNPEYDLDINGTLNVRSYTITREILIAKGGFRLTSQNEDYGHLSMVVQAEGNGYASYIQSTTDISSGSISPIYYTSGYGVSQHLSIVPYYTGVINTDGFKLSTANIGINTRTPEQQLDVNGNAVVRGQITCYTAVQNASPSATPAIVISNDGASTFGNTRQRFLGMGVNSGQGTLNNNSKPNDSYIFSGWNDALIIGKHNGGSIRFSGLRDLDGIEQTELKVDVYGNLYTYNGTIHTSGITFKNGAGIYGYNNATPSVEEYCLEPRDSQGNTILQYGSSGFIIRNNLVSTKVFINGDGKVGIGTIDPGVYHLNVNGGIQANDIDIKNLFTASVGSNIVTIQKPLSVNSNVTISGVDLSSVLHDESELLKLQNFTFRTDWTSLRFYMKTMTDNFTNNITWQNGSTFIQQVVNDVGLGYIEFNEGAILFGASWGTPTANSRALKVGSNLVDIYKPIYAYSTIYPSAGNDLSNGIVWKNPEDGSEGGYIRYYNRTDSLTPSDAVLEIGTTDDYLDHINLKPSGSVGIKTNKPEYTLDVNGNCRVAGIKMPSTHGISWDNGGITNVSEIIDNGQLYIKSDDNIYFQTNTPRTTRMHILDNRTEIILTGSVSGLSSTELETGFCLHDASNYLYMGAFTNHTNSNDNYSFIQSSKIGISTTDLYLNPRGGYVKIKYLSVTSAVSFPEGSIPASAISGGVGSQNSVTLTGDQNISGEKTFSNIKFKSDLSDPYMTMGNGGLHNGTYYSGFINFYSGIVSGVAKRLAYIGNIPYNNSTKLGTGNLQFWLQEGTTGVEIKGDYDVNLDVVGNIYSKGITNNGNLINNGNFTIANSQGLMYFTNGLATGYSGGAYLEPTSPSPSLGSAIPFYITNYGDNATNTFFSVVPNAGNTTAKVGIGVRNPAYTLDVNGNVNATSYNAASDYRLKTNVSSLGPQINTIMSLDPKKFTWKNDGREDTGFLAQDVFKELPHLRMNDTTGDEPVDKQGNPIYLSLDYSKLTPYLWKGMQELIGIVEKQNIIVEKQNKEIEELKQNVTDLLSIVNSLKAEIQTLK